MNVGTADTKPFSLESSENAAETTTTLTRTSAQKRETMTSVDGTSMLGHRVEQQQHPGGQENALNASRAEEGQEGPADLETDRSQQQFATNNDESPSSASSSRNLVAKIHDSNSSDDDDDDDDGDIALLNIPPGISIMDHLSTMPNLSQADRLRVLSRVDVEAKRKEVAVYVGEKAAGEMQELEVVQKFNQLDNWKFSLVSNGCMTLLW